MGQVIIETDESGEGSVLLAGVHHSEIDLVRLATQAASKDALLTVEEVDWHHVRIGVGGAHPNCAVQVLYRGAESARVFAAVAPKPEPEVEPEPEPPAKPVPVPHKKPHTQHKASAGKKTDHTDNIPERSGKQEEE